MLHETRSSGEEPVKVKAQIHSAEIDDIQTAF